MQDSLLMVVRKKKKKTGRNVLTNPNLSGLKVTAYIQEKPFDQSIQKLAEVNDLLLNHTEDGFYMLNKAPAEVINPRNGGDRRNSRSISPLQNRNPGINIQAKAQNQEGKKLLSVKAVDVPLNDLISEAAERSHSDYIVLSKLDETISVELESITFEQLLTYAFQGSKFTFKKSDNVFLLGLRTDEGFRTTDLVRLRYRSVEEMETFIPKSLIQGVNIQPFNELNGIILSGGAPEVAEIKNFIQQVDQLVPNILIEVIVATVRKGFSLETGISAGIGEEPTTDGGTLFPGVDFTLGAESINKVLENLSNKGIVNLGKVNTKFYMTLKAMEENNHIDIKSTPKLSTINGNEANLVIGKSEYYLEETQNVNGGVNPITTVSRNYRSVEANMAIKISPMVSGNEHVTLTINAEFSDFIPATIKGAPPGNETRKFDSKIRVKNEEMIILGGLEEVANSNTGSGFPVLSRIPVLKWFFSSQKKEKREDRLVVFIRPTIVY